MLTYGRDIVFMAVSLFFLILHLIQKNIKYNESDS